VSGKLTRRPWQHAHVDVGAGRVVEGRCRGTRVGGRWRDGGLLEGRGRPRRGRARQQRREAGLRRQPLKLLVRGRGVGWRWVRGQAEAGGRPRVEAGKRPACLKRNGVWPELLGAMTKMKRIVGQCDQSFLEENQNEMVRGPV
jgi:hypothetical protein